MIQLQNKSSDILSQEIIEKFEKFFGDRISDFKVSDKMDEPFVSFLIHFKLYNYFIIGFGYDRGSIGCGIVQDEYSVDVKISQGWYSHDESLQTFLKELDEQVRLRIPDKYLEYYYW